MHRARAALRGVAADVAAGQQQFVAKELHQQRAGIDDHADRAPIDGEGQAMLQKGSECVLATKIRIEVFV